MFRLQVTIIRQTFQYMDMTCSVLTLGDPILFTFQYMFSAYTRGSHIVYICCVEFQTFRLIKKLYRLNELLRL
jgi:hypothetical protein